MNSIRFRKLDVRPLLLQGLEPYPEIRKRVDALKAGEGLELTASFLPSPLVEKLKSEGFQSSIAHQGDGAWVVQFWRDLSTETGAR